jgi:hypothetical protein
VVFYDRKSPFIVTNRSSEEVELLALSSSFAPTTVLNLAGLWGNQRLPRNWLARVAPTKEALKIKVSMNLAFTFPVTNLQLLFRAVFT